MIRLLVCLMLCSAVVQAAPRKVAVRAFVPGEGVSERVAATVAEAVAGELRKVPDLEVSTQQEISAALSLDQQKQLLACSDEACSANFAGLLGIEALVTGNIARLGESWLVNMKLIDVVNVKTLAQSDRRLRGGTIDDVLDLLPAMALELFGLQPKATLDVEKKQEAPAGGAEIPADVSASRARLELFSDGEGRYLARDPEAGSFAPFYAGSKEKLFAQRVQGGGRSGTSSFSTTFWDPRAPDGWMRDFGLKDGAYYLQCGKKKLALKKVEKKEAGTILASAQFFQPRWQRQVWRIARNDLGDYFLVDRAREDAGDFRLYIGPKGSVAYVPVNDAIVDDAGEIFITPRGRLRFDRKTEETEWIDATGAKTKLVTLDPYRNAAMAYSSLGAYREPLGTACDDRF